jgi:transcriptional regulator with XRE-family HTH domain
MNDDAVVSVAQRLRAARRQEGLTLAELAQRSGVSIATISKIETGKISGGFETIYKIARGLGLLVTDIITESGPRRPALTIHRATPGDVHATTLYDYHPQATRPGGALNPYLMVIKTTTVPDPLDWSNHQGEEFVQVLSGTIEIHHAEAGVTRLEAGDSACFDCGPRHAFVSVGEREAVILSVSTRIAMPIGGPRMREG